MTGPRLGQGMPTNDGWIARQFADLQRQITELRAARTLDASTIGAGGITVIDNGSITVGGPTDDQIVLSTATAAGRIAFLPPGNPTDPAYVKSYVSIDGLTTGIQMSTSALGTLKSAVSFDTTNGVTIGSLTEPGGTYATDMNMVPNAGALGSVIGFSASDPANSCGVSIASGASGDPLFGVNAAAWAVPNSTVEWKAVAAGGVGTYIPILASAFTVSSSEAVKEQIASVPFDALAAVENAPAKSWRYKPDHATETHRHIGPMAEALPPEIVHISAEGEKTVDLLTLVGVLWDAVGKLSARVSELST